MNNFTKDEIFKLFAYMRNSQKKGSLIDREQSHAEAWKPVVGLDCNRWVAAI